MRLTRRTCINSTLALLGTAALPAVAADNPRDMVRLAKPGHTPPPASLKDAEWLQGHWIGDIPEGPVDVAFLPPKFGHMPSFVRALNRHAIIFYEITTMVEVESSLALRLKHFTPELAGWEDRETYIERPLIARDGDNLWFHQCTYIRTGHDSHTVYFLNMDGDRELDTLVIPFRRV